MTGDFGCKGNGITVGLTDGTKLFGLYSGNGSPNRVAGVTSMYGQALTPQPGSDSGSGITGKYRVGITTETQYSGIITDTSGLLSVKTIIKF